MSTKADQAHHNIRLYLSISIMPEEEWFERESGSPSQWKWFAEGLIGSADVLRGEYAARWPHVATPPLNGSDEEVRLWFVQRSALLLLAIAIENLLKGLRVARLKQEGGRHVQPTKTKGLQIQLGGHDLVAIADAAGVSVTFSERALLQELSEIALWSGRYSLPLHSRDFAPEVDRSDKTTAARALAGTLLGLYPKPTS